jgi:ABC-2 type transport system ATP-binding protein
MSVSVAGLTKRFDDQIAVNELSFEARPGEILGFLGPNGAGKTTTMKMICGYMPPDEGTAVVEGYDVNESPLQARRKIGYLPEHNPLYDEMYIREFLRFVASIHKIEDKDTRIEEVITMTGLEKEKNKVIGTLSKGYRQRVGLAQAIIHDPAVLILDEPTSGLDMNQLIDIRQLIRDLGKEKTVIFSSHIMQEVQALCDRVVIINNGALVADEPIGRLTARMGQGQTIHLEVERAGVSDAVFSSIPGVDHVTREGNIYVISSTGGQDIRKPVFEAAVKSGLVILEMKLDRANVEEVFRKLTKSN